MFLFSFAKNSLADSFDFHILKGKGSALGVGRGRAVAMRARVSYPALPLSFLMAQSDIYCPKMVWQLGARAVFSL